MIKISKKWEKILIMSIAISLVLTAFTLNATASDKTPTAKFDYNPKTVEVKDLVIFDGSSSLPDTAHNLEIVGYVWTLTKQNPDPAGTNPFRKIGNKKIVEHIFDEVGTYEVTLTIFNVERLSDSITKIITVTDGSIDGKYKLRCSVEPENAGQVILDPTMEEYDLGDIVDVSAVPSIHSFPSYRFDYWSGDATGIDSNIQIEMDGEKRICAHFVRDEKPVAIFGYEPSTPEVGQIVGFDGDEYSYDPDGGAIVSFNWYCHGPDSITFMGSGSDITYSWDLPGNYNVELRVIDDEGDVGSSTQTIEVIIPSPPQIACEPSELNLGSFYQGNSAEGSFKVWNSGGGELEFEIEKPNDIFKERMIVSPNAGSSFGPENTRTIYISIDAKGLNIGNYQTEVTIKAKSDGKLLTKNVPISFSIVELTSTQGPIAAFDFLFIDERTVEFDASGSYDPDGGDLVEYTWSLTSNEVPHMPLVLGEGKTLQYTFDNVGTYTVNLMVVDDEDESDTSNKDVTISDTTYYTLNVLVDHTQGSVDIYPPRTKFIQGEEVTLTAIAKEGYEFDDWNEDYRGSDNVLVLVMESDKTIEALFKPTSSNDLDDISINIVDPEQNSLYFRGRKLLPLKSSKEFVTVVFGDLDIKATVQDVAGNITYEFYLDDDLKETKTSANTTVEFSWCEKTFFRHTVKIKAYDEHFNTAEDSIEIMIFNFART